MRVCDNFIPWSERIVSALSYLSAGWIGLFYCIIMYIKKSRISHFVRFNVIQSIFFALLFFVLSMILGLIFNLLSHIPLIQLLVSWVQLLFFRPFILQLSVLQLFIDVLLLYFVGMSLLGKYPVIYKISKMLNNKV